MSDFEFVDPTTGAALGAHAFGTVAAGTASTPWPVRLRYRWGQSGSGAVANALVMRVSENGGSTWRDAVTEFTLAITAVSAPDPLFTERARSLGRGTRWALAPFRAGCYADLTLTFTPDKRTGAAEEPLTFRLGIDETPYRAVAEIPDAPSGVLSGIGVRGLHECIVAPTLATGTYEITLGAHTYVYDGVRHELAGEAVALSQDDGDSETLSSGEEYVAVTSVGASGRTLTKGAKATAGTAVPPALPEGERPETTTRVPYGGGIVTSTLHAVSGRCAIADAGGLDVTMQPGRLSLPGWLAEPTTVQTATLPDDATTIVRGNAAGALSLTEGVPLAIVETAAGDIVSLTPCERLLGLEPIRISIPGDETVADARAALYLPYEVAIDTGSVVARVASTGATGTTDVELELDGTPIATGSIAAQGTSGALTFTAFTAGPGWLTVDGTAITSGGTRAADLEVVVWAARRG